jgi:hypothetical protein
MGRIFHGHGRFSFSLVVINQLNVKSVCSVKAENDTPVGSHRHGPETPQIAFERMQPVAWKVEGLRRSGSIQTAKNTVKQRFTVCQALLYHALPWPEDLVSICVAAPGCLTAALGIMLRLRI